VTDESFTLRGLEFGSGQAWKVETPIVKFATAPSIPISRELLADVEDMRSHMERQFRRMTLPWEFADANPFPHVDPVPWFTSTVERAKAVRQRIRDVRYVLRHGLPDYDDEWD
jgi:hypothetical protein